MFAPSVKGLTPVARTALLHTWPHTQQVVIAAAGQVSTVRGPLQPAHLLGVTGQCADVMLGHPHIVVMNVS